jgi:dTDP-4-dehydrorhamnose 3,5-epimerase
LHYQLAPEPQAKLVRSSVGSIFDVAIDIRQTSPTFGQWIGTVLSAESKSQLWIPEGFAHGFLTLSAVAEVQYKTRGFWNQTCERAIRWDDPTLAIDWPQGELNRSSISLSEKDAEAPDFISAKTSGDLFP